MDRERIVAALATLSLAAINLMASALAPLSVPRAWPMAFVRSDGKIYVANDQGQDPTANFELYEPEHGSLALADRPMTRAWAGEYGVLFANDLLICDEDRCDLYDAVRNAWTRQSIPGADAPFVKLDEITALRPGGAIRLSFVTAATYLIRATPLSVERVADMNRGRYVTGVAKLSDGRVLAAGGVSYFQLGNAPLPFAEIYDPATNTWTEVARLVRLSGSLQVVALRDGRALAMGIVLGQGGEAEIYEPRRNTWSVASAFKYRNGAALTALPDGTVMLSGGEDQSGTPVSEITIFDPTRMVVTGRRQMSIRRSRHEVVVLPNGRVLAIGGTTTTGPTASVEELIWLPTVRATLDPGFYVATSTLTSSANTGLTGIEVNTTKQMDGGLNFGGSLPGGGGDVAFAGFYLPEAQTVSASVNFQPQGGAAFEATVRLLDANKEPEAPPVTGGTHIQLQHALAPGFHVIELQSGQRSPPATYQFALSAPYLSGGAVAGAVLDRATSAPAFAGFYLSERQEVNIRLFNENAYGSPRGAGEVILTLYDSAGRLIAREGSGVKN